MTATMKNEATDAHASKVDLSVTPNEVKDRKERADLMMEDLHRAVETILSDDNYLRYLEVIAHNGMSHWSFNNRMIALIQLMNRHGFETFDELIQSNTPICFMGFKQWAKFDRKAVRGGATFIFAPMISKREVEDKETGEKEKRTFVRGFTTATVFNVTETEGEEIVVPEQKIVTGTDATHDHLAFIVSEIEARGFEYSEEEIPGCDPVKQSGTRGYTSKTGVVVDERLPLSAKVATAAHELGHIACGHIEKMDEYKEHRGRMETEADSFSYLLTRELGVEAETVEAANAQYIVGWSKGNMKVVSQASNVALKAFREVVPQEDSITAA